VPGQAGSARLLVSKSISPLWLLEEGARIANYLDHVFFSVHRRRDDAVVGSKVMSENKRFIGFILQKSLLDGLERLIDDRSQTLFADLIAHNSVVLIDAKQIASVK